MLCESIFYVIFAVYQTLHMLLQAKFLKYKQKTCFIIKGLPLSFKINNFFTFKILLM